MKVFAILFCMVIGYACVDLHRVEIGENDVKAETGETEASEKPPSVATPMIVTSEIRQSGQRVYLGKRLIDLWSLLKHSHRNFSTGDKRSFSRASDAIRDTDTDFEIKTRRLVRTKRAEFSADRKQGLEDRNLKRTKKLEAMKLGASNDFDRHGTISQKVKGSIEASVRVEARLLDSLQSTSTVTTDLLNEYKAAKTLERKTVREAVEFAPRDPDACRQSLMGLKAY